MTPGVQRAIDFRPKRTVVVTVNFFPLHELASTHPPLELILRQKEVINSINLSRPWRTRCRGYRELQGRDPPQQFVRDRCFPRTARGGDDNQRATMLRLRTPCAA